MDAGVEPTGVERRPDQHHRHPLSSGALCPHVHSATTAQFMSRAAICVGSAIRRSLARWSICRYRHAAFTTRTSPVPNAFLANGARVWQRAVTGGLWASRKCCARLALLWAGDLWHLSNQQLHKVLMHTLAVRLNVDLGNPPPATRSGGCLLKTCTSG